MTNFAYLRVSKDSQDVANQKHGIEEYADAKRFRPLALVEDTASGTIGWRKRGIGGLLLESAKEGDVVLVSEISRLGRNVRDVLEIMEVVVKRKVELHVIKDKIVLDNSMQSTITVTILALAGYIERELISARTKEALARRKKEGLPLGRPKGRVAKTMPLDERGKEIRRYLKKEIPKATIAKLVGCSRPTLNKWLKREGLWVAKKGVV